MDYSFSDNYLRSAQFDCISWLLQFLLVSIQNEKVYGIPSDSLLRNMPVHFTGGNSEDNNDPSYTSFLYLASYLQS